MNNLTPRSGIVYFLFLILGIITSCKSDDQENGKLPPEEIEAPTKLISSDVNNGVRLEWHWVIDADKYELSINDGTPVTVNSTWYVLKFGDELEYDTSYTWKVRALKGNAASEWATATLVTIPMPDVLKFIGVWDTDSVKPNASMDGNALPIEGILPNWDSNNPDRNVNIAIDENPDMVGTVYFSIAGINNYLPIGQESLNRVLMSVGDNGTLSGSVKIDYSYTYEFPEPIMLSELENFDEIRQQVGELGGSLLQNASLNAVTITVKEVFVSGQLEEGKNNKAVYTISTDAPVNVITSNLLLNSVINQFYFSSRPLKVMLKVYSTKKQ